MTLIAGWLLAGLNIATLYTRGIRHTITCHHHRNCKNLLTTPHKMSTWDSFWQMKPDTVNFCRLRTFSTLQCQVSCQLSILSVIYSCPQALMSTDANFLISSSRVVSEKISPSISPFSVRYCCNQWLALQLRSLWVNGTLWCEDCLFASNLPDLALLNFSKVTAACDFIHCSGINWGENTIMVLLQN